jgi:hypothetical protein
MKFVDKLLSFLKGGFDALIDGITFLLSLIGAGFDAVIDALFAFIKFLAKPLSYLLEFLEGIFYFIMKLFEVAISVIMIFVSLFQFMFAIIGGVFRTITSWLTVNPSSADVSFPSVTYQGFEVVIDLLQPTGMLTVVPLVALAFLWFYFAIKIIGLFGGTIMVTPIGRGN